MLAILAVFLPKVIILDIEFAAINAFKSFFPDVDIELP